MFIKKFIVFSIFIMLLTILFSGIIFPIDFFTKRFTEAVIIKSDKVDSFFIPNLSFYTYEYPDRKKYEKKEYLKKVFFQSDKYGFRNFQRKLPKNKQYDIILYGNSNIYGSYYTQSHMLSEKLIKYCNCKVYNMHNKLRVPLIKQKKFNSKVFISFHRNLQFNDINFLKNKDSEFRIANDFDIFISQLFKTPLLYNFRSKAIPFFTKNEYSLSKKNSAEFNKLNFNLTIERFKEFNLQLQKLKIKHILFIHPTGNIYETNYLKEKLLNDIEIDLIIETPSIDNYWLTQDSHWNDKTIEDTALNLIRTLSKLDPFFSEKQIKRRLNDLDFINWNKINKYDKKTPNLIEYFSNKN